MYIYSIAGEVNTGKELDEAEGKVKESLVHSICDEPELSTLLQKITGMCALSWLTFSYFILFIRYLVTTHPDGLTLIYNT